MNAKPTATSDLTVYTALMILIAYAEVNEMIEKTKWGIFAIVEKPNSPIHMRLTNPLNL